MNAFILTMVITLSTTTQNRAMVSIVTEYGTQKACEEAKELNRAALADGRIILATCTRKVIM